MEKTKQTTAEAATLPVKAAGSEAAGKAKSGDSSGFYCYIGPSIVGLIQHGTVYRGTRRAALAAAAAAIEKYPLIKTLIVSGDALPEARLKVKKPGNALYKNYQRVAGNV